MKYSSGVWTIWRVCPCTATWSAVSLQGLLTSWPGQSLITFIIIHVTTCIMYIYIIHVIIHVNNFHSFPAWRVSTWSQTPSTVIVTWPGLRTGCEGNNYFVRKIFPNLINENISDEDWPTVDRVVSSQPTWRTKPSTVSPATSSDAPVSWINYRKIFFLRAWKISLKIFWIIKNVFRNCWLQFNICISIGIC